MGHDQLLLRFGMHVYQGLAGKKSENVPFENMNERVSSNRR
jgi:hypothetical protein